MLDDFNEVGTRNSGLPKETTVAFPMICFNVEPNYKYFSFWTPGFSKGKTSIDRIS